MRVLVARFSSYMISENVQVFWAALQRGEFISDAAGGRHVSQAGRPLDGRQRRGAPAPWSRPAGPVPALRGAGGDRAWPGRWRVDARDRQAVGTQPVNHLRRVGTQCRGAGTVSGHQRARRCLGAAARPKPAKLATNLVLRGKVEQYLEKRYSPEQITGRLRAEFPNDPQMWVSHETIYQSLYVQSRGALRRELTKCLRTGRALRHPGRQPGQRKNRIPDMVNISERPVEAADRAVPGHWEGDLIIGKRNASAIGTLVERTTGYVMLVHLPDGYKPEQVAPALAAKIQTLPQAVRRSLTWDQGPEMRDWKQVAVAADVEISFCDPHKPWQRGTNENTNGLLRQYFPKGTDLSAHSKADLDWVAAELNDRPRKRFGFAKPDELIGHLLLPPS
jgi:IS30 family transposase